MTTRFLPAARAAARLGIQRASLYAYVSRGRLHVHHVPGRRGSWFDPMELDALARRARGPEERIPELRIASAITLIERGHYWYRGRDVATLVRTGTFESVAEWLWTGASDHDAGPSGRDAGRGPGDGDDGRGVPPWRAGAGDVRRARRALAALPDRATPIDQVRLVVTVLGASDPLRGDIRPAGAVATARRLMANLTATLGGGARGGTAACVARWLDAARADAARVRALDRALIVMADHELASSTLAVRTSAAAGADPYAAIVAGLGPLSGQRHGAASRQVERCLQAIAAGEPPGQAAARLMSVEADTPGFGHPLYPDGDPRVSLLWPVARTFGALREADALLKVARTQGLPPPNVDLALAALTHRLGLGVGAGEALFTIGRVAGWLAHAIETYGERHTFRLRAVYTGPRPEG